MLWRRLQLRSMGGQLQKLAQFVCLLVRVCKFVPTLYRLMSSTLWVV